MRTMKLFLVFLLALIIGILLGIWYGKQHPTSGSSSNPAGPNHIQFVVEGNTKVDLSPQQGDVITWLDVNNNPVDVKVSAYAGQPDLCRQDSTPSECIVAVKGGIYPYSCTTQGTPSLTCFDPGISPGRSPGSGLGGTGGGNGNGGEKRVATATRNAPTTITVPTSVSVIPLSAQVYCDAQTKTAKSATDPLQLTTSNIVEWVTGDGVTGTVTLPAGSCQGQPANGQYKVNVDGCQAAPTLSSAPVPYTISLSGCDNGRGTIQLVTQSQSNR
jgi:hypothetical protein